MIRFFIGLTLIVTAISISSCSKEKSQRWIVADIQVVDKVSGLPVESNITLKYTISSSALMPTGYTIGLGDTDSQGKMNVEHEIPRKASNVHLEIRPKTGYYVYPWSLGEPAKKQDLQIQGENSLIIELQPLYPYTLFFHNVNCTGPTDTLWMGNSQTPLFTGCVDTSIVGLYGITWVIASPTLNIDLTSKKAGIVTNWTESFTLTPSGPNNLQVDY